VAEGIRFEAEKLPHGKTRKGLLRKATALLLCGTHARVLECGGCGELQAGSGVVMRAGHAAPDQNGTPSPKAFAHGAQPCRTRVDPLCGKHKAREDAADLVARVALVEIPARCSLKMITLTAGYDPTNPEDLTVEALRARVEGLKQTQRAVWKELHGIGATGGYWRIENAGSGNVHMHMLVIAPFINKKWLDATASAGWDGAGFTDIKQFDSAEDAAREICKYVTKSPGPRAEDWYVGGVEAMHPTLAARWEVAMHGATLSRKFGCLRGLDVPPSVDSEMEETETAEREVVPCRCGCSDFSWTMVQAESWVRQCHMRGVPAFVRSKWDQKKSASG
jgi:hypothetical protein